MSSSLAAELAGRLSHQLDQYAALLSASQLEGSSAASSSPFSIGEDAAACDEEQGDGGDGEHVQALASLTSLLSRVTSHRTNANSLSLDRIQSQADEALAAQSRIKQARRSVAYGTASVSQYSVENEQVEQLQWILNSQITISAWGAVLRSLLDQAEKVKDEESYWQAVEGQDASGAMYLVQTFPVRVVNVLRTLFERLKVIADSPRPPKSLFSMKAVRRALPPSLLITSLFPHLSVQSLSNDRGPGDARSTPYSGKREQRSLLFLTFSPLLLTRQEVAQKRKKLNKLHLDLAKRIGGFVKDAESASVALEQHRIQLKERVADLHDVDNDPSLQKLGSIMGDRVAFLESSLGNPPREGEASVQYYSIQPRIATDLLTSIQGTLKRSSAANKRVFMAQINAIYNSRESIQEYYTLAKETVRGFVMDWVVDPCLKILATLRHGDSSLAIMGRESLKSDFDVSNTSSPQETLLEALRSSLRAALYFQSLERMVADFAKDMKLSPEQIADVANRVREGDMSLVLGAYENDLKSPLKSAVTGTLVRSLLIQVQKVKVDVDVAMDGIEKMLKSQQLTFAFVGVAPSMLLLYLASSWLRGLFRTGPSRSNKALRKRVWYTMRSIDRILTATLDSSKTTPKTLDDVSVGLLLIELTTLREYVASRAFPSRDRSIKAAFLEDVRDLEKSSSGLDAKLRAYDRLSKTFGRYLKGE